MRKIAFISILILLRFFAFSQQKESFNFKFIESSKEIINTTLTRTISIDNVKGDTVFAYANSDQMIAFRKLGYKYTIIPKTTINTKSITMATTVAQMANWDKYPTYSVYRGLMKKFEQDYPALCKLDSIGITPNGHQIYVVKLSNNVTIDEPEVETFYTSSMHGDEITGYPLMLRLIDSLLSSYATSPRIAAMLDNMAIYINPNANPDGTYNSGNNTVAGAIRENSTGYVDINRNFPDPKGGAHPDGYSTQPETQIMMDFASARHFTLSANFHGGVELVNYPWDTWLSSTKKHPDHNWFVNFSRQYADSAQANSPEGYFTDMNNGITHGGDWYVVEGGRQDYMNWWHHCREITIEISSTKLVSSESLPNFWNYNKEALLGYLESATQGFKGVITNSEGEPIKAKVFIDGHDADSSHVYSSSTTGFYARPIEPGTWSVTYSALGYQSQTHSIKIANWNSTVEKNIELKPLFNLIFDVKESETPLENVNISFNSINKQTSSNGQALYSSIPEGDAYSYTVSMSGYHTATGQVNIIGDRTISINLIPDASTVYTVSFDITNQSTPVEDATIQFNGVEQETSTTGSVTFTNTLQNANYSYSVSKLGYQTISGQTDVTGDKTLSIELIPYLYSLDINVKHLGVAIPNASVTFNGIENQTISNGTASFSNVLYGNGYSYSITKAGYKTVTGKINVISNNTLEVELIPIFDITFNVSNQGLPLANAKILFNSRVLPTNSSGIATFSNVLYGNSYPYTVSRSNYNNASGVVDAVDNKNINIELTSVGVTSPVTENNILNVWPNPFASNLNISFNLTRPTPINVTVYTIDGRLVKTIANKLGNEGLNSINCADLNGINDGSYIIVLRVDNKSYSQIIQHIR